MLAAVKDVALMHVAGAIHEHIDLPHLLHNFIGGRLDLFRRAHIELQLLSLQPIELCDLKVGRNYVRAFGDEGLRDCPANALPCGGDESDFALQAFHELKPPCVYALLRARDRQ